MRKSVEDERSLTQFTDADQSDLTGDVRNTSSIHNCYAMMCRNLDNEGEV